MFNLIVWYLKAVTWSNHKPQQYKLLHSFGSYVGLRAQGEESAPDPPEGELRQPGAGWGAAEGPLHGRGQGQEAATPTGKWDWERVSLFWSVTDKLTHKRRHACQQTHLKLDMLHTIKVFWQTKVSLTHFYCSPPSALRWLKYSCVSFFSVKNLHDRWAKDCANYREVYNQKQDLDLTQKIDWGPLLDEKQVSSSFK